jgi:hypothetical protein
MTGPTPPAASKMDDFERAFSPILNDSPQATDEEIRECHRRMVCGECSHTYPAGVPCEKGAYCENAIPIPTGGPADAEISNPPSKRRRGAPKGNTNALTHGFYASKLRARDARDLNQYAFRGLKEEILILRYYIRRVVEQTTHEDDLEKSFHYLRAVTLAVIGLSRLLRTEKLVAEPEDKHPVLMQMDRILVQMAKDKRAERLKNEASGNVEFNPPSLADASDAFYRQNTFQSTDPDWEDYPDPNNPNAPD